MFIPIETETTYTNQLTKCTGWIEQKKGIGIKSSPVNDIYVACWMLLPKQDETMNTTLTRCLEALGYVVYQLQKIMGFRPLWKGMVQMVEGYQLLSCILKHQTHHQILGPLLKRYVCVFASTKAKLVQGKIVLGVMLIFIQVIHTLKVPDVSETYLAIIQADGSFYFVPLVFLSPLLLRFGK